MKGIPIFIDLMGNILTQTVFLIIDKKDKLLSLDTSLSLRNHSPTGFSWGYGGSGPSQLALAILLEILPNEQALNLYQEFKWAVIAKLPQESFFVRIHISKFIKSIDEQKKLTSEDLIEHKSPYKQIRFIKEQSSEDLFEHIYNSPSSDQIRSIKGEKT